MGRSCPVIVAMKGHPGTGKSTLAHAIASAIRCPLIDKDDIRDCTGPLQQEQRLDPALLNDLSYSVLWQMAKTQLDVGLDVVIDCPLSRRAHLDRLMQLGGGPNKARVIIVECRPSDHAEWRRRLEERAASAASEGAWQHKPRTWEELQMLVEGYQGRNEYETGDVPKLVVDTTGSARFDDLVARVLQFIGQQRQPAAWRHPLAGPHFRNDLSQAQVM